MQVPKWALDKIERKTINNWKDSNTQEENPQEDTSNPNGNTTGRDPSKGHIAIPYMQGLGKSIKKAFSEYGIQTPSKGNRTIKQILVNPKDKDPMDKISGAIY